MSIEASTDRSVTSKRQPPVHCEPWCRFGDGHADAWHRDDQWCTSPDSRVNLSPSVSGSMSDDARERLNVMATRRPSVYRGRPVVEVWLEERDVEVYLSTEDAYLLAAELTAAARMIEEARR